VLLVGDEKSALSKPLATACAKANVAVHRKAWLSLGLVRHRFEAGNKDETLVQPGALRC